MANVTRRDVVTGALCFAGLFALGGIAPAFAAERELLRPPGAAHGDFRGLCIMCDRCRTACPTDCITYATVEDGLINARTPKLDFHQGYCDFCNKCIEVCPTGALIPFDPAREKLGIASIDPDICLAYTRSGCDECVAACDFDAIVADDQGLPLVVEDACNGCGKCVYVCPSNVYGSFGSRGDVARAVDVLAVNGGRS